MRVSKSNPLVTFRTVSFPLAIPAFTVLFPGAVAGWVQALPTQGFVDALIEVTAHGAGLAFGNVPVLEHDGFSVPDTSENGTANLAWDDIRLPHPVFAGDTIYSRSEILETRESRSRPNVGIVRAKTTGFNQDGTVVIEFMRTFLVYRRGHVPEIARVRPQARKEEQRS